MRAIVLLADDMASARVAGRSMTDHWAFVGALAGLEVVRQAPEAPLPPGPVIVVDGRFAALAPDSLRALAARSEPGSLCSPAEEVAAALVVGSAPGPAAAVLVATPAAAVLAPAEALRYDQTPAEVEWTVRRRWLDHLARNGVRFVDPDRTLVDTTVSIGASATIWPDAVLRGSTRIGEGVEIQPGAFIEDTEVEEDALVRPYTVASGARIGPGATVGPFAHLRQGAVLEAQSRVGNFVEVKQATLRRGAKAGHLTYLGDAEVGADANIGAGTITCNYDGFGKYRTIVGPGAFVGSNTALVAPVTIGAGAIVGAGSVVTQDVPDEALFIGRAVPKVFEGRAPSLRERNRLRAKKSQE